MKMDTLIIRDKIYYPTPDQWVKIKAAQEEARTALAKAHAYEDASREILKPRPTVKTLTNYWSEVYEILDLDIDPIIIKP